jgi:hypothetical protein
MKNKTKIIIMTVFTKGFRLTSVRAREDGRWAGHRKYCVDV